MQLRADRWKNEAYPFGSEMAWDSTGQEEVYAWCKRFGYEDKAQVSLNSILAYDPTLPHWGYNGNARRYWDFIYGGKLQRIERQIHHFVSGPLSVVQIFFNSRPHLEVVVIKIEAMIQPEARIQHRRADDGSGGVSAILQNGS